MSSTMAEAPMETFAVVPCAVSGPAFFTTAESMKLSPPDTCAGELTLTPRSAAGGAVTGVSSEQVCVSALLPVTVAVLVIGGGAAHPAGAGTLKLSVTCGGGWPGLIGPRLQGDWTQGPLM